jgi:WD40 repeat protein
LDWPEVRIRFSPDGKSLAVGAGPDGTIYLLESASGKLRRQFKGHQRAITALEFSADGKTLASGSQDTTVLLWDLTDQGGRLAE